MLTFRGDYFLSLNFAAQLFDELHWINMFWAPEESGMDFTLSFVTFFIMPTNWWPWKITLLIQRRKKKDL